jgi:hypothetical protein
MHYAGHPLPRQRWRNSRTTVARQEVNMTSRNSRTTTVRQAVNMTSRNSRMTVARQAVNMTLLNSGAYYVAVLCVARPEAK